MIKEFEHKGYRTKIKFDPESAVFFGKIEGIKDLVNFEGQNIPAAEKEFHNAVDDYLELCKALNRDPDREKPIED